MGDTSTSATGAAVDADGSAAPGASEIPRPAAVAAADEPSGYVVWHRKHLRLDDHRALTRAVQPPRPLSSREVIIPKH